MSESNEVPGDAAAVLCDVYRSPRREGMYLYVPRARGLRDVPDALRARFGEPVHALGLMLSPDRRLARADAAEVLRALAHQGWYLQMPPAAVPGMQDTLGEHSTARGEQPHAD